MSGRRTAVVLALGVALLLGAGTWGVVMLRADATQQPHVAASPLDGPLTARQYTLAVHAAERSVDIGHAHLTSATALIGSGPVHNQDGPCRSGQRIEIRLIGRFPRIHTSHLPGGHSGPVTSVEITADGTSGRSCGLVLGIGKATPYHHAANLLPALSG